MSNHIVQCALVTGGSKGIGREISLLLSQVNHLHIIINYSNDDNSAMETLELIHQSGGTAELLKFKVNDSQGTRAVIKNWLDTHEDHFISVLVNNAGIKQDGLFLWMEDDHWNEVIDVNLNGMFYVTKNILPQMIRHKYGRIINISSVSGITGIAGQVNYSASKAGMIGATKSLAVEVAKMGITVNALAPGFVESEMINNQQIQHYIQKIPMNRIAKANEIAHLVSFLASENSSYITGEIININGGLYT